MPTHKLTITYDDATGHVHVNHRTHVEVGDHAVSHSEPVVLGDDSQAALAAWLKGLLESDQGDGKTLRAEMEARALTLAVQHVAAVTGKLPPRTKTLHVGGSVGPIGNVKGGDS